MSFTVWFPLLLLFLFLFMKIPVAFSLAFSTLVYFMFNSFVSADGYYGSEHVVRYNIVHLPGNPVLYGCRCYL